MQRPLQISFHGIDHSDYIESRVREKAMELERFSDEITSCHVTVDAPHHHQRQGTIYSVRLDIRVPDGDLVINKERRSHHAHEDVYVAIRDAFDAATRQLEDRARRRRGKVKRHETPVHGKVVRLDAHEGFGFIETSEGIEVYFHQNSVIDGFAKLKVGDEVRLVLAEGEGEKGIQASSVSHIGKHHLS